jgi:hypothetical protein
MSGWVGGLISGQVGGWMRSKWVYGWMDEGVSR